MKKAICNTHEPHGAFCRNLCKPTIFAVGY